MTKSPLADTLATSVLCRARHHSCQRIRRRRRCHRQPPRFRLGKHGTTLICPPSEGPVADLSRKEQNTKLTHTTSRHHRRRVGHPVSTPDLAPGPPVRE